jgi:hypothetical protein
VVFIVHQPGNTTLGSATVGADGSFAVPASANLSVGDSIEAHAGSAAGPMGTAVSVGTFPLGPAAAGTNSLDAGATVLTASGVPGEIVVVVDTGTGQVLGQGVIGSNGQGAVFLNPAAPVGATLDLVVGGAVHDTTVVSAIVGQPASLDPGFVFVEGNVLTGHGTPGAQVQLVDNNGAVLGSTTVAPDGTFSLPVSGAQPGVGLKLVQNGVAVDLNVTAQPLGDARVFVSKNIFKPLQGGTLDIGFKAVADEHVTIRIFNLAGELVRPVAEMDAKNGVVYALSWDGKNDEGQTVASGVYFVSARGAQTHILKKVIVLK